MCRLSCRVVFTLLNLNPRRRRPTPMTDATAKRAGSAARWNVQTLPVTGECRIKYFRLRLYFVIECVLVQCEKNPNFFATAGYRTVYCIGRGRGKTDIVSRTVTRQDTTHGVARPVSANCARECPAQPCQLQTPTTCEPQALELMYLVVAGLLSQVMLWH